MKKKTWKTGPFIQDEEKETYSSDFHYRCQICDYSNMGHHDASIVELSGPTKDRQMFMSTKNGDVLCYQCIDKSKNFGFSSMDEFYAKKSEWKALRRPNQGWGKDEKPVFDKTAFGLSESSKEFDENEWDLLEKFNTENLEEYWEEILEKEGLEVLDIKEKNNNGKEEQIHIPLLQGHSEMDELPKG